MILPKALGDFVLGIRRRLVEGIVSSQLVTPLAEVGFVRRMLEEEYQRGITETERLVVRLKNVDRVLTPLSVPVESFVPGARQLVGVTVVVLLPNGRVETYTVGFPFGQRYTEGEFYRRLANAIMNRYDETNGSEGYYDPFLSAKLNYYILATRYYAVEYRKI